MLNLCFERLWKSAEAKCIQPPELANTISPGLRSAVASRSLTELTGNNGPTLNTQKLAPILATNSSAVSVS
jgi:hypothetical protein